MNTNLIEPIIYNQIKYRISTIFYRITVFLIFLFFYFPTNLYSQKGVLKPTQNLTISEGLAHNGVTSILEDSRGYLWIGTFDGLNRYDGYKCKVYKNTVDKKIFINHRVRTVKEDAKGNLWIGTDEGVTIYKYQQDKFENIHANQEIKKGVNGPIIRDVLINEEEVVAVTDNYGILFFDKDYSFKKAFIPPSDFSEEGIVFFKAEALDRENYLFSTSVGLLLFNTQKKQFRKILKSKIRQSTFINFVNDKTILVTLQNGIGIVDYEKNGKEYSFSLRRKDLTDERVNSLKIDTEGDLWLGTLNKGALYIDHVDAFLAGQPYDLQRFILSTPFLRASCFSNTSRGFWFGTFDNGIFRFDLKENPFKTYSKAMNYDFDLQSNSISSFSAIDSHRVYITSKPNGLSLFNTQTKRFEPTTNLPAIIQNSTKIFVDSRKNLWFKANNQSTLFRKKADNNIIEEVSSGDLSLNQIVVHIITEDADGNIWVGTENTVYRIQLNAANEITDIESLNENPFFSTINISRVRAIYFDKLLNCVWVGSSFSGLFKIDLTKNESLQNATIDQFTNDINNSSSISSNFVSSIIRSQDNTLWLTTERGGICQVLDSDKTPTFQSFSEKQGLSNNVIKNIITDDGVNLWLSTNIGLNLFNTKDLTFRKFSKKDGLPFEAFDYSALKLENGQFLFSGFNGICYFNPNEVSNEELLPTLEFGDFKVVNNVVNVGDKVGKRVLFSERLKDKSTIKLKYNENVFSIEVMSLHFSNTENHYLKYQLLPVNEDWIEVPSNQRTISYSGLQPGEYTLRVKASNSLNNWTEVKELTIVISPPFWKTTLAYILYIIAAGFLLYYGISVVLRIQSLNHNLEIEKLQKDNIERINAAKLRFFANISHEIKTPITLISGPISLLRSKFKYDNDISDKLQLIERQSKKISQLVDQVHDFQKADSNILKINYNYFCFDDFIKTVTKDFEFMANNDDKELIINKPDYKIYVSADKDKLEIVLNNLLNNAFKYTKAKGTITINYTANEKDLNLSVSDTGHGISSNDLPFIFDRFYQSQKKHNTNLGGAGIGLAFSKRLVDMHYGFIEVESEYGNGTTFSMRLPIVKEAPIENQETVEAEILSLEESYGDTAQINETIDLSAIKVDSAFANAQIFMAEDNSDMRIFVAGVLSNFFEVKTFANGQECLDAMEEEWPDLIVSDVSMPELNGLELCKHVKSDIKTSHIPIVLLTACVTVDDQIQGIKYGADAYIRKPFNVAHLVTTTEALLKNRQQLRERFQVDFPMSLEKTKVSSEDTVFLEKLYDLIAKNLDNNELNLDSFAKNLYLNRTHFYQKVKALTNQTPYELLKEYRLKKAAEFLTQEKRTVNEVFLMTGFKSRTHFSKLFKERYNISPGKFAKSKK